MRLEKFGDLKPNTSKASFRQTINDDKYKKEGSTISRNASAYALINRDRSTSKSARND